MTEREAEKWLRDFQREAENWNKRERLIDVLRRKNEK